jgi:hypothetical protein
LGETKPMSPVQSDEFAAVAQKLGLPATYVVFPDEGHGCKRPENESQKRFWCAISAAGRSRPARMSRSAEIRAGAAVLGAAAG